MTVVQDSRQRLGLSPRGKCADSEAGPMIVIVDERELVTEGYISLFDREGVDCAGRVLGFHHRGRGRRVRDDPLTARLTHRP